MMDGWMDGFTLPLSFVHFSPSYSYTLLLRISSCPSLLIPLFFPSPSICSSPSSRPTHSHTLPLLQPIEPSPKSYAPKLLSSKSKTSPGNPPPAEGAENPEDGMYTCVCLYVSECVRACVYICMSVSVCGCMCSCVCLYTHA